MQLEAHDLLRAVNQHLQQMLFLFPRIGGIRRICQVVYERERDTYYAFLDAGIIWQARPLLRKEWDRLVYFLGLACQCSDEMSISTLSTNDL